MAGPALHAGLESGGNFSFIMETDNVEVAEEICRDAGYVAIEVTTLGVLHGYRLIRQRIEDVVDKVFGNDREDQQIRRIVPGSLHVDLHCLTDERFFELLRDYESGGIKERLQKEFTEVGIKVEGLNVAIENMEEVNEIKAAINERTNFVMAGPVLRSRFEFQFQGGNINFTIETNDVNLAEGKRRYVGYAAVGVTTLGVLYGNRFIRRLINTAVNKALDGINQLLQIRQGSLHVDLDCLTDERFLEVLKDYESGGIKERLQKEFAEVGIKVEGLKVAIENTKEVNEIKAAINKRLKQSEEDSSSQAMEVSPRIIVQGGAYRHMPPDKKEGYMRATKESAQAGYRVLMDGKSAVDAVETAVLVLENNENFNAGRGSLLNNEGQVECDAMIMEGHTLNSGAVICGRHFLNPVSLAKEIMYNSSHCVLSGDGALKFAQDENINFETCTPDKLISKTAKEKVSVSDNNYLEYVSYYYDGKPTQDTVSAVAMDANGHLACALSTGGIAGKLQGRVGDAPLVGCGGYVNKIGGASATGHGESILKVTLAREIVYNMERGQNAQESAENALKKMKHLVDGNGGVITIDKNGNFGKAFTTELMVWASIKDNTLESGMEKDEVETEDLSTQMARMKLQ